MESKHTDKTVAVASDHAGYALKSHLVSMLKSDGYEVVDVGTDGEESVDYPVYADALVSAVQHGRASCGVLVCGTGIGMSIAANRHPGIRAALCHNVQTATMCRQHNDANVLALGSRVIAHEIAEDCVRAFLSTEFEAGGRHERRVSMMG